jgi:hypothetical protein
MNVSAGEVISYADMCQVEGMSLQRGMNFRPRGRQSVILMSTRSGAPYADRIEEGGKVLIYEGHDADRSRSGPNPKTIDQPQFTLSGNLTQNGRFLQAVEEHNSRGQTAEEVRVYEKIKPGIWTYNGIFRLIDGWQEESGSRLVFKFRLEITQGQETADRQGERDLDHQRVIPSAVKIAVWKRDGGVCVQCGSPNNLHFDHILPFSKGGTSLLAENIQLLCARHNLAKSDRIE